MLERLGKRASGETGSAYMIALLVLFLMTIFGLSLVVITQTEREIGVNQQTLARSFYSSDSGSSVGIASLLTSNDFTPKTFETSRKQAGAVLVREVVNTSRISALASGPCNLCQINQGSQYFKINHGLTTTSRRVAGTATLAQKGLAMMVEIQPREQSAESVYDGLDYN